ncbi:TadE/TadG family type IV pilus assembly protein [Nocardioides sp.]|uniref:TadE/TadG family type IV pilus assembly protein n=1 Tax=Nocardioides sp. TaxID=35761 RepID=UPI0027363747|nr:TadE/TadG family type IV pilus assembly protein [Nocardioides sp.]MDP3892585.1 TadE/TadG family type IV pilus assembly protein [Nocardioides sp.]
MVAPHMVTPPQRTHRTERGAAAVEFALVVPLLLMMLFGTITTGLTFADHLSATNAVREAARYGAAADVGSAGWAASVKDRLTQVYFNAGETVNDDQVCVRLVQAGGTAPAGPQFAHTGANCGPAPALPSNMAAGSCAVLVWMQRPQTIRPLMIPDLNFMTRAESVAYYGRVAGTTCTAL